MRITSTVVTRTLTIAALTAAATLLTGCSLLNGIIGGDSGVVEGEGEDTNIFAIAVGDCVNNAAAGDEVTSVPTVDCALPHDSEVYASIMMADGDYPGETAVTEQSQSGCLAEFEGFIGLAYETSVSEIQYYFPTAQTWANGDREILCLVFETDGSGNALQTVGTLEGSAR